MYFFLFGKTTDALEYFYRGEIVRGIYILEQAHRKTEEMAMKMDIIPDM